MPREIPNRKYPWSSLTEELRSGDLPLSQWFSAKLPNLAPVYKAFGASAPTDCLQPPAGVPADTAGSAFEYCLQLSLEPALELNLTATGAAWAGISTRNQAWTAVAGALVDDVHQHAQHLRGGSATSAQRQRLTRGCWGLALFTQIARGMPYERSALTALTQPTLDDVLALMPAAAEDDIAALLERSHRILLPFVASQSSGVVLAPVFHSPIPADADLIAGNSLIEIKAVIGRRRQDRTPRWGMDARTIYQLVGYGLLAQAEYTIDKLVLFNPRYEHLHTWPLDALLTELAGAPVHIDTLAAELRDFLDDPFNANAPQNVRRAALTRIKKRLDDTGGIRTTSARRAAAEHRHDWLDLRRSGPRWPLYAALLEAATPQERATLTELVAAATGCRPTTLRSWLSRGVPDEQVLAVRRAAAVSRLGGIDAAAAAFGLTVRRTRSWLAGRGNRTNAEFARIEAAIAATRNIVSLHIQLSGTTTPSTPVPRRQPRHQPTWTLQVREDTVEQLHSHIRLGYPDAINSAIELLAPPLREQHGVEIPRIRSADILTPDSESDATYVLTAEGINGPGYPPIP